MNVKKTYLFVFYLLIIIAFTAGSVLIDGCKRKTDNRYVLTGDTLADGKNLVQIHCTKCHALVPVNALSKAVWGNHTLPAMAPRLHISTYGGVQYFKNEPLDTAGVTLQEWLVMVAYYKKAAPGELPKAKPPVPVNNDWAGFTLKTPATVKNTAFTTMAAVNPNNHKIYTSDAVTNELVEYDSSFKMRKIGILPSTAVNALFEKDAGGKNTGVFSNIGQLEPIDFPNGRVLSVDLDSKIGVTQTLIGSELARPVQTLEGDFDKNGLKDYVILGQGRLKGGIYLFKQNPDHSYTQSNISDMPGAVQAVAGDFNNDGWQDLMILFGRGDEGLWLFLNNHKGGFTVKNLLRFPPVYGSTSFQLADIDHDGKPDLIYTCGYNFNDSRILKPYHGLYIFKNAGNWNFKQEWFYPINGCTKAIAADFDGDGDMDIATSAFYADLENNPGEGFIYFEQVSPFNFKPHSVPISKYGRWMSMDVADYNNDGKPDIILGNYSTGFMFQAGLKPFWQHNLPFVVLENTFKK